ncbi:hypothetical protein C8R43DRAFT_19373 [Mycena crocata]|nr:hypothetical protein C8R43DRAFT_19373 [Mycena crocata]
MSCTRRRQLRCVHVYRLAALEDGLHGIAHPKPEKDLRCAHSVYGDVKNGENMCRHAPVEFQSILRLEFRYRLFHDHRSLQTFRHTSWISLVVPSSFLACPLGSRRPYLCARSPFTTIVVTRGRHRGNWRLRRRGRGELIPADTNTTRYIHGKPQDDWKDGEETHWTPIALRSITANANGSSFNGHPLPWAWLHSTPSMALESKTPVSRSCYLVWKPVPAPWFFLFPCDDGRSS